jgi:aminoglycoside phosphotransferase (APT) family kinase protein
VPPALPIRAAVERLIAENNPGTEVLGVHALGIDDDAAEHEGTSKATGYGQPVRVRLRDADGSERSVVLHTATANIFGHDRRADRAADMLLAFDTFNDVPDHVRALDVGAIHRDGRLISLADVGEFFVLTGYAEGHVYAEELRALGQRRRAEARDLQHAESLGRYLAALHQPIEHSDARYVRALRDLVGSGEGIFGIVDGYPASAVAGSERLAAIERRCVDWRWRLKSRRGRLCRIHGDFHPFNVLFDDGRLSLLDASRGCAGDPADDMTAMAVNFVFFALQAPGSWKDGFSKLWYGFWTSYLEARPDDELLAVAAPYLAWRTLVVANPAWYPEVGDDVRDALLRMAEQALACDRIDLAMVEELFR